MNKLTYLLVLVLFSIPFSNSTQAQTTRNLLLEEFSGTWCGLCPQGMVFMDSILNNFNNVIGVAIHQGDPMMFPAGENVGDEYTGGGVPAFLIDRYLFPDYGFVSLGPDYALLSEKVTKRFNIEAPLSVSILNFSFDEITNMANVTLRADVYADLGEKDLRFNLYVVEDNVSSSEPGYAQSNYYSAIENHPFEGLGSSISNFNHRYVCRSMAGGAWGAINSISASSFKTGDSFQFTFSIPFATVWEKDDISFVALVQQYSEDVADRAILNAEEISFNAALQGELGQTTNITKDNSKIIGVYPNPITGNAKIEFELNKTEKVKILVLNEQGKTVDVLRNEWLNKGMHTIWWNTDKLSNSLTSGVYFVTIETKGDIQSKKISIVK